MKKHRPIFLITALVSALLLSSCNGLAPTGGEPISDISKSDTSLFEFDGRRYTYNGDPDDIRAEEHVITVVKSGSYILSGKLDEGRIVADCIGEVRFILDGFSGNSSYGAVIESRGGASLVLETAADSVNLLTSKKYGDLLAPDGCIVAEGYLRLCGDGSLTVRSEGDCGVVCLGDAEQIGGKVSLGGKKYGIWTRDSFSFSGGKLTVISPTGIYADCGGYSAGEVKIIGGTLTAICEDRVIFAGRRVELTGGSSTYDAPEYLLCKREENGESVAGEVIETDGFTKIKQLSKK